MTRTQTDPLPGAALAAVGGPLGRHASVRARSWIAIVAPLFVAAAAAMSVSVAQRAHCIERGWNGQDQFWHACFSDLPALYQIGALDGGVSSYLTGSGAQADHPVLTGAVMSLLGGLVPGGSVLEQTRWYFALWALLATVLVLAMVYLTAAARPLHAADAAQVALSPVLVLTALLSADVLGVALATAGIWAWAKRRPALAGVLLGLAVMARTYPLLILVALVLLGLRTARPQAVGRTVLAALATGAALALPFLAAGNLDAVLRPYRVWWDSAAGLGSPWMVPQLLGHPLPDGGVTLLALVGIVVAVLAGTAFALGTWRRPTLAEVSLVLVALVLVTGKSFPVQASLWLVPLVALCGVRWRDHLVWAGTEVLHFVAVWMYVGGLSKPDRGLPPAWYAVFLLLRVAGVGYLMWRVWRTAAQREVYEPVDAVPDDEGARAVAYPDTADSCGIDPSSDQVVDELAGDFTDAPDRLIVRLG